MSKVIIPIQPVAKSIYLLRGQRVILDFELARLYSVTTGNLNKAVNRNRQRFPADFMFQLTAAEADDLIFQFGRSKGRGGRRHLPYAFTEEGVALLSLKSERIGERTCLACNRQSGSDRRRRRRRELFSGRAISNLELGLETAFRRGAEKNTRGAFAPRTQKSRNSRSPLPL